MQSEMSPTTAFPIRKGSTIYFRQPTHRKILKGRVTTMSIYLDGQTSEFRVKVGNKIYIVDEEQIL